MNSVSSARHLRILANKGLAWELIDWSAIQRVKLRSCCPRFPALKICIRLHVRWQGRMDQTSLCLSSADSWMNETTFATLSESHVTNHSLVLSISENSQALGVSPCCSEMISTWPTAATFRETRTPRRATCPVSGWRKAVKGTGPQVLIFYTS